MEHVLKIIELRLDNRVAATYLFLQRATDLLKGDVTLIIVY